MRPKVVPLSVVFFFFQAEDGIRDFHVTGVQTCALPISRPRRGLGTGVALFSPSGGGGWCESGYGVPAGGCAPQAGSGCSSATTWSVPGARSTVAASPPRGRRTAYRPCQPERGTRPCSSVRAVVGESHHSSLTRRR